MTDTSLRFLLWSRFSSATSASALAQLLGINWPPPPTVSLRDMASRILGHGLALDEIVPPDEAIPPRTTVDPGYHGVPPGFVDTTTLPAESRLIPQLRNAAALRDGDAILKNVCQTAAADFLGQSSTDAALLTAMTQLAVTGSNAFAKWSVNKTRNWVPVMESFGIPAAVANRLNDKMMADFDAAVAAVRASNSGTIDPTTRDWIAVSAEDDPPDFPVNIPIAPFPQFHLPITVNGPSVSVRYFIASDLPSSSVNFDTPSIPPGDEVVIYIHGEGSRAEEALDLVPRLLDAAKTAGRHFTLIALDLPGCGYTKLIDAQGVRDTPDHLTIAAMPPTDTKFGVVELSSFAGAPILDFVQATIIAFVEALVVPMGNKISAVVGGSLGGHMSLRLAASGKPWIGNVIAWSPASVMDHTTPLKFTGFTVDLSQRVLTDPHLAKLATETESTATRSNFFNQVWDQDTFNPKNYQIGGVTAALLATGVFSSVFPGLGPAEFTLMTAELASVLLGLEVVPPQPQLWYRDGWASKVVYINESRWERQEVYTSNFRRWHWRICEEMVGFKFDSLIPSIQKPLQLLVGEIDNYPQVHFLENVMNFAKVLAGPGRARVVTDTGHSIHNERPTLLASQIIEMPILRNS